MTPSEMNAFNDLLDDQQHQVIAQAMRNENISWQIALAALYPQFKDTAFLSKLIQQYKHGLDKQPATSNKRKSNEVTSSDKDNVAAATNKSTNNSKVRCRVFKDAAMMNHFNDYPETETYNKHIWQEATGGEHRDLNVNNITDNSKKNTEETHPLLARSATKNGSISTTEPCSTTPLKLSTL
mmetsp:Transcript_62515/g.69944  ORF Transcript_62515/g.69944 Transcript_62515/m.69944 type:complete len:182 (+) Transcript_62515:269-814(+)